MKVRVVQEQGMASRDPNTDSPLARGGQGGDAAQILSSQKKKKMARNRKRESCQLEAG